MRFTIGRKLGLGFGIPTVLLIIIGVLVIGGLSAADRATEVALREHTMVTEVQNATRAMLLERIQFDHLFTTSEEVDTEATRSAFSDAWTIVLDNAERSDIELELVQSLDRAVEIYQGYLDRALAHYLANPTGGLNTYLQDLDEADQFFTQIVTPAMEELFSALAIRTAQANIDLQNETRNMLTRSLIIITVGVIGGIISAFTISRSLTRAATYLSSATESISRGDMDIPIVVESGDEMEDLARSIERMRVSLRAAIERLRRMQQA